MTTKTLTARVPAALHERVTELANDTGASINQALHLIVDQHFKSADITAEFESTRAALAVTEKRILAAIEAEIE